MNRSRSHNSTFASVLVLALLLSPTVNGRAVAKVRQPSKEGETVILLHGILNRPMVMRKISLALKKEGYQVVNWGYPSTKKHIEEHADDLAREVEKHREAKKLHFVGFSMGSIVIRCHLANHEVPNLGRFVMIAPPNQGSIMADKLSDNFFFRWLYGTKSMAQLSVTNQEFFKDLGDPPGEFGIIAGGRGNEKGRTSMLPGDDDGTVCVKSTKLEGAKDFLLVNRRHTFLLFSSKVVKSIVSFLENGFFVHDA